MFLNIIQLLRPRHWVKNLFVLVPLVFAGAFMSAQNIIDSFIALVLFSIVASMGYIINDIHDIERDRLHPEKSTSRPLASGKLSIRVAQLVLVLLLFLVVGFGAVFFPKLLFVLSAYLALVVAYTYVLKFQPILDIFTIAIGFVLRIYAGALVISVPVSPWTFVTTFMLALFLASIKRRQELKLVGDESRPVLKYYSEALVTRFAEMSATGALICYSLFVLSERPELIITIPVVLYGLFRYWYVVESQDVGESPTDVLLKDWPLIITVVVWVLISAFKIL